MQRQIQFTAVLMATLMVWCAHAGDTLALKNGDILSGELKELSEGVVVFHTKFTGQVFLPAEEVRGIATAEPWEIVVNSEAPLYGRLGYRGRDVYVEPLEGGAPRTVELEAVQSAQLLPPTHPSRETGEDPDDPSSLELSIGAGYYGRLGARDYSDPFASVLLTRAGERWDFTSQFRIGLGSAPDWPHYFVARNEFRLHQDEHYYGLAGLDLERDGDIGLSMRGDLSAAVGRDFLSDAGHQLSGDTGIMVSAERFNASRLPLSVRGDLEWLPAGWDFNEWKSRAYYTHGERRRQQTDFSWRFRLVYRTNIPFDGLFTEDLAVYPSVAEPGEVRARSESAVQFPLTTRLSLRFDVLLDYERSPEFSAVDPWRTTVGAGVVLDF